MVSKASEDLPEPDSPVITTSFSRGRSSEMFLRLCSRAPRIEMNLEVITCQCRGCQRVPQALVLKGCGDKGRGREGGNKARRPAKSLEDGHNCHTATVQTILLCRPGAGDGRARRAGALVRGVSWRMHAG